MTWQPSHQHSMWALSEGTRTFNYFVSTLVSRMVNCLDAKNKSSYFYILHHQRQYLQLIKMVPQVMMEIKESRQIVWENGKQHLLSLQEGRSPVKGPLRRCPPLVLQPGVQKALIKGRKHEFVRAGMSPRFPGVFLLSEGASQACW